MIFFVSYYWGCVYAIRYRLRSYIEIIYIQVQRWCPAYLQSAVKIFSNTLEMYFFAYIQLIAWFNFMLAKNQWITCHEVIFLWMLYGTLLMHTSVYGTDDLNALKTKVRYLLWLCNMHFVKHLYCIALCDIIEQSQFYS